ncbi:hypothetical protein MEM_03275 [Candida albicans L26]|uniref:Bacteriophage T5 Orf172 DNA-binding domain-containing protein n=3 Tax=Candida albicans TaxID=5476 RepID=Q59US4_CANAL|nr:uncharacterized protein CAALFM_C400210WA [Candida albicans SC5314]KGQ86294.1 hypothetical protein MEO_03230 [Candida albicans P94015]KGQ89989.1 hypothetical protein MEU_03270 [Candida albicans P37005]KGR09798.1 hypothetical protein MG3_03301 [Candida albicans P78048]KGR16107.1 hypothetical protein MG9_03258 [Candida albicans P37037]KGT68268.1 hypothetical protein MEK_03282 [Candida albicans 12C]KGU09014.1 hypothetical protein MEY_03245 [Candida albicans 19F]KGU10544.1 hypothetical protein|eukprot:XP_713327.1 hypothetical protein CAALFM_C400210WA [Candida albicans SC5314]
MSKQYQCNGITTKGVRCRIKCQSPNSYCRHHERQSYTHHSNNHKPQSNDTGYIYMYTMTNFLFPPKNWSFKVKNLPDASKKTDWVNFNSRKSHYILIKIGRTTKTPESRIQQWQEKCQHPLTNMGPPNKHLIRKRRGLVERLACMSIDDPVYSRWKNGGFYCRNLNLVESTIHQELWKKYGKGQVYCVTCLAEESRSEAKFKIHMEWFLIPKEDIEEVYQLIDTICVKIG